MEQLQSQIWLTAPHIWGNICAFPHILGSPSRYMTLQLLHSEFPYTVYEENFLFFFISAHKSRTWEWGATIGFPGVHILMLGTVYAKTYQKVKKETKTWERSWWSATSLFPVQEPVLRDRHTPGGQPETGTRGRGFRSFKMAAAHWVWKIIYIFMKPGYKTAMKIKLNFYN